MSEIITIPHRYKPYDHQIELFAARDKGIKHLLTRWHRRCGKDLSFWNLVIREAIKRKGIYYYVFPQLKQGKKALFEGMTNDGITFMDYIPEQLRDGQPNATELKVRLSNGSLIQIIGTDKYDKVRGTNPVGVVYSEFAYQNPGCRETIRPILLGNGGWEALNSTPNGKNHMYMLETKAQAKTNDDTKIDDRWFISVKTIDETYRHDGSPIFTQEMLQSERDEGYSEEFLQQEYYVSYNANAQGYYYLAQMNRAREEGRIGNFPWNPDQPVYTYWDIGVGDSTAIWFLQWQDGVPVLIDFYTSFSAGIDHYASVLLNGQRARYAYKMHLFPHDMSNTEFGTGLTRYEMAYDYFGTDKVDIGPKLGFDDGIQATRILLNKCKFNEDENTDPGIKAIENYQREYNDERKEFSPRPKHDWCVAPDTLVRTTHGWDKISNIKVGDYVFGYSHNEGRIIPAEVSWSGYTRKDAEVLEIGLSNGRSITCTPDHLFLLADGTYVAAENLIKDSALMPFFENDDRKYKKIDLLDGSFADEHRYVYSRFNKNLILNGYHIDHIDGDHFNNDPINLQLLSKEEHCSKTFSGLNNKERRSIDNTDYSSLIISKNQFWIKCRNCGEDYWGSFKSSYCSDSCRKESQKCYGGDGPKHTTALLRVRYIRHIVEKIDTYDITVPDTGNFAAEGVIIHNCSHAADALRYCAVALEKPKEKQYIAKRLREYRRQYGKASWKLA